MRFTGFIGFVFCIVIAACVVNAGRGVRGGRYSSSRSNVRITQTRVKVRYGSRYRPWSYGPNNWWYYGSHGHIYGFVWYTRTRYYRDHPHREPTICRNEFDNAMDNGTHYEWFICPSEKHTSDYHYCCGEEDKQHCCRFWDDGWRTFGVSMSFLFFVLFVAALCYCCCCRKKTRTETTYFQRMMSRKISSRAEIEVPLQPVPIISPQPMPPPQPMIPPQPFMPEPAFMPMPMPQPQPGYPGPQYMPEIPPPGMAPPYPPDGGTMIPPFYTPYQAQPTAPPYSSDSKSSNPPSNPIGPSAPYPVFPYPTAPGYPNSPPPPYGQM